MQSTAHVHQARCFSLIIKSYGAWLCKRIGWSVFLFLLAINFENHFLSTRIIVIKANRTQSNAHHKNLKWEN
jgi:hypothetical protein